MLRNAIIFSIATISWMLGCTSVSDINQITPKYSKDLSTSKNTSHNQMSLECSVHSTPVADDFTGEIKCKTPFAINSQKSEYNWTIENLKKDSKNIKIIQPTHNDSMVIFRFTGKDPSHTLALMREAKIGLRKQNYPPPLLVQDVSKLIDINKMNSVKMEKLRLYLTQRYQYHLDKPNSEFKNFNRSGVDIMNSYLSELQLLPFGSLKWCLTFNFFHEEAALFAGKGMGVHTTNQKVIRRVQRQVRRLQKEGFCQKYMKNSNPIRPKKAQFSDYQLTPEPTIVHKYTSKGKEFRSIAMQVTISNPNDFWLICQAKFTSSIKEAGKPPAQGPSKTIPKMTPTFVTGTQDAQSSSRRLVAIFEEFKMLGPKQSFDENAGTALVTCLPCRDKDTASCFADFLLDLNKQTP